MIFNVNPPLDIATAINKLKQQDLASSRLNDIAFMAENPVSTPPGLVIVSKREVKSEETSGLSGYPPC
jgi:hypothetical protein